MPIDLCLDLYADCHKLYDVCLDLYADNCASTRMPTNRFVPRRIYSIFNLFDLWSCASTDLCLDLNADMCLDLYADMCLDLYADM